jgi:transposase InsO family protein
MGIEEVLAAPRSPWQNAYAERLIGSIRRECLDHVIVVNERSDRFNVHSMRWNVAAGVPAWWTRLEAARR